jgi:hypothetical protein
MLNRTLRSGLLATGCALAVTLLGAASANAASNSLRATITLRGYVPVICHADFNPTPVQLGATVVSLGTDSEFCNAGTGYVVTASYVGGSDPGHLIVDGRTVDLSASGQTVIASESGPDIVQRRISYVPGATPITTLRVSVQSGAI